MTKIAKERRTDITIIRVFSMFMIVLCHIIKFYTFIPGSQFAGQFLSVGVEIFFGISGFLYGKKTITRFKPWIVKRIQRICIPVAIIALVSIILLKLAFSVSTDGITVIAYMLNLQGLLFINWNFFDQWIKEISTLGPLWFTTIIMICYLLVPCFQKIRSIKGTIESKKKRYMLIVVGLLIVCFLLGYTTGTTLFYIVVFLAGYAISDLGYDKMEYSAKRVVGLIATVIVLATARIILRAFIDGTTLYSSLVSIGSTIIGLSLMCLGLELYKKYRTAYDKLGGQKLYNSLMKHHFIFILYMEPSVWA